jgi:uncharacterized membrane protein
MEIHPSDGGALVVLIRQAMEASALGIEVMAVAVIVLAIVIGTGRYLFHLKGAVADAYLAYKTRLVKALLLGLEFLVAADIVRTVALQATLQNVAVLGALVVIRTLLSWSLVVEIDGRWPWEKGAAQSDATRVAVEGV